MATPWPRQPIPVLRQRTIEALPQLVLSSVCEYLAHGEPRRASLLAFASTSRTCRAASWRERFAQVSIDVDDAQFHQRLEQLERILDEAKSRVCVRVLKLGASTVYQTGREDGEAEDAYGSWNRFVPKFHPIRQLREWKPKTEPRPDEWWQPLVRFISSVHLKDLMWASTEQMPRCILAVLNEKIPGCRLHVHGFDLRSLHQREPLQDIDDTEYMLATSPCLYSIVAPYSTYDTRGCANYNGEATLLLAAGQAPNLKHICVWDNSVMSSGELRSQRRDARPKWRGFHPQSGSEWCEIPGSKGQLQSLAIHALRAVSGSQFVSWERHVDFSVLRSLQLARQIELDLLQNLANLAERDGLSRLKALGLPAISCEYEDRVEGEWTMTRLFLSLHPLVELGIVGAGVPTFEAILKRHGDKLQVFRVKDFILSPRQITQLRDSCPNMRELSIEILRTSGDHIEVETYRTLGSMRSLQTLSLTLQCTDYRYSDGPDDPVLLMLPSDDKEDQEAMATTIRQVFINAAIDESLARSISHHILTSHSSTKANLPPSLNTIHLRVGNAPVLNGQTMGPDFEAILAWIGRRWVCRRDPRDSHQSDFSVGEVDSDVRIGSGEELDDEMDELAGSEQFADVWRALWPGTGGAGRGVAGVCACW